MEMDERVLHSPLFLSMESAEIEHFLDCTCARTVRLERGRQCEIGAGKNAFFGILLSGSLSMVRYDAFGNRFLLEKLEEGELFGLESALSGERADGLSMLASTSCELLLMEAGRFLSGCDSYCDSHRKLYLNIMQLQAKKSMGMVRKQYHMAQRTLRRKLSSFLSEQSGIAGSNRFQVQMDRQELADYLGVDRSALCAELSRMRKEGLLDYHRHDFHLKDTLLEECYEI